VSVSSSELGPPPHPLSRKRMCTPPPPSPNQRRGEHTRLRGGNRGLPIRTTGEKLSSLPTHVTCTVMQCDCALGTFNFQNLTGFKLRMIDICKQIRFWKMFENIPFFEHTHSKFAKSANAI
jgi:hypothetical protein